MITSCPECKRPYGKRERCYYCQPGRKKNRIYCKCQTCGKIFQVQVNAFKRGGGVYCSASCRHIALKHLLKKELKDRASYINKQGYVMVPIASGKRKGGCYKAEHRLAMEAKIGRKLLKIEHIHHIDGNKTNNVIENLLLLSNSEHQKYHDLPQRQKRRTKQ